MTSLNVVALISGGKDSFFSILHCQANGHNIVALANLHPPEQEDGPVDDMESYMYQTVGHAVIPLYEKAVGLPLFRQPIDGTAVDQAKSYGPSATSISNIEDETESLLPLLRKVIAAYPEVNAVSTGAILSDYQRTRVESVALRLGLTPLSFLWHWPSLHPHSQTSLLEDMSAVGQDSRIVKVASGGLDDGFLWSNVADPRTIARLSKAARRFGSSDDGAVLGEGGEYETLAVNGPAPLWKGRIVVPEEGLKTVPGEAGSFSLQIAQSTVIFDNDRSEIPKTNLRIPSLLDARFEAMAKNAAETDQDEASLSREQSANARGAIIGGSVEDRVSRVGNAIILSNIAGEGESAGDQTRSIMEHMIKILGDRNHAPNDIAYTVIVLRDMADFAAVNAAYGSYFKEPNPPARVTIACADVLPPASLLTISFTSTAGPRQGLHVQSRSYWAPANIGPYSQAIGISPSADMQFPSGAVFIAGQIPLIPASMSLPEDPARSSRDMFRHQAILALQHLDRIGSVMKVKQWTFGIAFVASSALTDIESSVKAQIAQRTWRAFHSPPAAEETASDEAEEFDIWHSKHGGGRAPWQQSDAGEDDSLSDRCLPPPTLVVIEVDSLPRDSAIEWIGSATTDARNQDPHLFHLQALLNTFRGRTILTAPPH